MGIPELWEVLRPAFDARITIDELVDQYITKFGRPPRVAIDAYIFIFHADHSSIPENDKETILTQNFMSKILALVGLNISVMVVFDGILKPDKSGAGKPLDHEKELEKLHRTENFSEPKEFIQHLKDVLKLNSIEFVQATGEAEAQCAYLQKLGIVDFVITNDVDSLVFGATQVLRNYSRFVEDIGHSPTKKLATLKQKYYVTPVNMSKVEEITGLTRSRLVFLATLRGGDYSSGVKKMGIKNATNLALSGTLFGKFYNRSLTKQELQEAKRGDLTPSEPPPDFSEELEACFVKKGVNSVFPWDAKKDKQERETLFSDLLEKLNELLRGSNRDIFGRGFAVTERFEFDEYFVLLYFFPLVQTRLPVFLPWTLSSGELSINFQIRLGSGMREELSRVSEIEEIDFDGDSALIVLSTDYLFVPKTYNWQIKYIIFKLASYASMIKVTNEKLEDGIGKVMLKYDEREVRNAFPMSVEARRVIESPHRRKGDEDSISYIWVPKSLVEVYYPQLLDQYIQKKKEKFRSKGSKTSLQQKTTLDQLDNSPIKKSSRYFNLSQPIPFEIKPSISPPKRPPTKKKVNKPSPKKQVTVVEGQRKLDFFLKSKKDINNNPFLDPDW